MSGDNRVLLATKMHVPGSQPHFVSRGRLVERLLEARTHGLVLVCAPAGFGKTALLTDWLGRDARPAAWLSLDAADNDPARFWRHVVAAVDRVRPGIAKRVAPLLGPPQPSLFEGVVTALINELAGRSDDDLLLVLNDRHVIDSPPVHASLAYLLEHRPARMQLVLAGRSDPPLPLARLRVRGQLVEVRAADLRFRDPSPQPGSASRRRVPCCCPGCRPTVGCSTCCPACCSSPAVPARASSRPPPPRWHTSSTSTPA
jgi:LuxR family maltose regulon positive regulatory protein